MIKQSSFEHILEANEIVKPWLMLGPVYEDVSREVVGKTRFERPGSSIGAEFVEAVFAGAMPLFAGPRSEGDQVDWRGQSLHQELVRMPDRYLSVGTYYTGNHMCAALMSTVLTPAAAGSAAFRLTSRIDQRIAVAVGGQVVLDTDSVPATETDNGSEWTFDMDLAAGENEVCVMMVRIARMARVGFCLESLDGGVTASVRPNPAVPAVRRQQIEDELASLSLERDIYGVRDRVGLNVGVAPQGKLLVSLEDEAGRIVEQAEPEEAGFVTLAAPGELVPGTYAIRCGWLEEDAVITEAVYKVRSVDLPEAPLGYAAYADRQKSLLTYFASQDTTGSNDPWNQVARYAINRYDDVDEQVLANTCDYIDARLDCADFRMNGLLRLMYWEREESHLSAEIKDRIKSTVLGFKYWVDEPGDTVMWMDSENHRMLFHTAEWMAGQLYPTEMFTNSGQNGLFHAAKGRMLASEWIRQRGHYGFDEFHSNTYQAASIMPLANVLDFALYEDHKLRQLAEGLIDYMAYNLAADTFKGVHGSPHGRSYGDPVKYPVLEGTSPLMWLFYGTGSLALPSSMGAVAVASSRYKVPEVMYRIAHDDKSTTTSRVRQGVIQGWQGVDTRDASYILHRTPDYMIASIQDHLAANNITTHPAQVTLNDGVSLFWSCPEVSGEGGGLRPDYWAGSIRLPRIIQHQNVMALSWRLPKFSWMSHCWFERARFDEVREGEHWVFARKDKAYVAIHSQCGYSSDGYGQYKGRELQCASRENTWLVECGREADWESFEAFCQTVGAAAVIFDGDTVTYHSPSIGTFVAGWAEEPSVNGEALQCHGYPLVDSEWAHSAFGSGEISINYGGQSYDIHLNL